MLPLAFFVVFYFYPLAGILRISLLPEPPRDWGGILRLFETGRIFKVFWFTFWQAGVSTLLTLVLAMPGVWIFSTFEFFGKKTLYTLVTVPFVLPTVVVAAAFQALLGPRGLANAGLVTAFGLDAPPIALDRTIWIIFAAHVFYNYAVALRIVGGFWRRIRPSYVEAARMLGASGLRAFFRITLPLLFPAIVSAGLLIFVFCFSSFGVILILGGPRFATVEVEIYRQALHLFNLPAAAVLSICQIGFTFLVMWVYARLQIRAAASLTPSATASFCRRVRGRREKLAVAGYLIFLFLFQVMPLLALVARSVWVDGGFSPDFYLALLENPAQSVFYAPPYKAVALSLAVAGMALVVSLVVGGLRGPVLVRAGKPGRQNPGPLVHAALVHLGGDPGIRVRGGLKRPAVEFAGLVFFASPGPCPGGVSLCDPKPFAHLAQHSQELEGSRHPHGRGRAAVVFGRGFSHGRPGVGCGGRVRLHHFHGGIRGHQLRGPAPDPHHAPGHFSLPGASPGL